MVEREFEVNASLAMAKRAVFFSVVQLDMSRASASLRETKKNTPKKRNVTTKARGTNTRTPADGGPAALLEALTGDASENGGVQGAQVGASDAVELGAAQRVALHPQVLGDDGLSQAGLPVPVRRVHQGGEGVDVADVPHVDVNAGGYAGGGAQEFHLALVDGGVRTVGLEGTRERSRYHRSKRFPWDRTAPTSRRRLLASQGLVPPSACSGQRSGTHPHPLCW